MSSRSDDGGKLSDILGLLAECSDEELRVAYVVLRLVKDIGRIKLPTV